MYIFNLKKRTIYLFDVIGPSLNYSEILPPKGGWTKELTSCIPETSLFGKFFIKSNGTIDYMGVGYQSYNIHNFHYSLIELAVKQLEEKCKFVLSGRAQLRKFNNLYFLLKKCHKITSQ